MRRAINLLFFSSTDGLSAETNFWVDFWIRSKSGGNELKWRSTGIKLIGDEWFFQGARYAILFNINSNSI